MPSQGDLMSTSDVAAYLTVAARTLKYWRQIGFGPPYARLGARVVYRKRDLDAFVDESFEVARKRRRQ